MNMNFDSAVLIEVANKRMPFGKYAGRRLIELPEAYLVWFSKQGFPPGKLGELLALALIINTENLLHLVKPLVRPD